LLVNDYAVLTGGAETSLAGQRDLLRKRGHEVAVFASDAALVGGLESFADYHCKGTTSKAQTALATFNPSAARGLSRAMSEFRPDVVHVKMFLWQLSPSILQHLEKKPSIYEIMTYKAICPKGTKTLPDGRRCTRPAGVACFSEGCLTPQSWLALMLQRCLWLKRKRAFARFVTASQTMRLRLEENGVAPCQVIPFGCPERPPREEMSPTPLLAYAGRLSPEKGVMTLLQAMVKARDSLPGVLLLIAGEGPERKKLEKFTSEAGLLSNVHFMGNLGRAELEKAFEPAWVQVVPSLWEEPFGIVTIEAMMRGTAVIASNHGGGAECVADGRTGLLFAAGDSEALADAILRLIGNKALCETLGAAGRERALREYSLGKYATAWEECYGEVLLQHRSAPL
jgi:glycosyltransferase involved in cell wall biosynthesis